MIGANISAASFQTILSVLFQLRRLVLFSQDLCANVVPLNTPFSAKFLRFYYCYDMIY